MKFEGKEYRLLFNNKVIKELSKNVNIYSDDSSWLDDDSIIADVGFNAAKQGAIYDGVDFPYSREQFESILSRVNVLEVQNSLMQELKKTFDYILENFNEKK